MHRRAVTAVLTGATVALTGSVIGGSVSGDAQAADPVSPLRLTVPDRVVARSYDGEIYSTFGVRMVAQGENFEIHATRESGTAGVDEWWDPSYNSPITAAWKREAGDVSLGEMSSWLGLDDFATIRVVRPGRDRWIRAAGCFNGDAQQVGPAAPLENPYPWGCPWNPFTLGSVMGVAQDYAAPLLPPWGSELRLRPGTYELRASISRDYRELLGISEADGKVSTQLVVKEAEQRKRTSARVASGTDDLDPVGEEPGSGSAGVMADTHAPDLRALPAFGVELNGSGTALRFGATVWNGGAGPMVIEGFRDSRTVDHMTAYQYYVDEHGEKTGFEEVGELHFHEGNHNHWHFEDFARYRLLAPDAENPNLPGEAVVRSRKQSFCLVATDAVDLTVPNADMRPEYTDLGSQCGGPGALSLREVLANGHGDTYYQYRTGQAFRLGDLEDGTYFIAVEANPDDSDGRNLRELDYANNDSLRKVELYTRNGERRVRELPVGIIDEQAGFEFFRTAR
jgi:hypothetical protein